VNDAAVEISPSDTDEQQLAKILIAALKAEGVPVERILSHHTQTEPARDRAFELGVFNDSGKLVSAAQVKLIMRQLLTN
jgi:hypothetical protein